MNKIKLQDTTFIIPIKVEHPDRYRNAKTTLGFLNSHFKTNVFIYEISDDGNSKLDFIKSLNNLSVKHWIIKESEVFHRTKYLNIMLDMVETKIVVNYDIDVILSPNNYLECQDSILKGEADVIYPYEFGRGQIMVHPQINLDEFYESGFDIDYINNRPDISNMYESQYGHCIFFNTAVYKKYGGENESFISYGPEDMERGERFKILGARVEWKRGYWVYHFEHHRGDDSSPCNTHFNHNCTVYKNLKKLSENNLGEYMNYYSNPDYAESYKTIGNKESS